MSDNYEIPEEYLGAKDEFQKASASIAIARRKTNRVNSREWANTAARHAEKLGIENARDLLGKNGYPDLAALDAVISGLRKSELVVVTRHAGLVDWLKGRGYNGRVIDRATPSDVLNKHVIGKLPIYLSAIAASVTNVSIPNIPESKWGDELTAQDLDRFGAYMRTYIIKEVTVIEPY
jgi:putative CRISPR-associated protein (TIGR02620 family)